MTIGFVGAGKMAEALIGGLIQKKVFSKNQIVACAPSEKTRIRMWETYGISMYETAKEMAPKADMIVIAVKPKNVAEVFAEGLDIKGKVLVSIVAGLTMESLKAYAPESKIVRVMPNHCCMVLEGAMGYTCDSSLTEDEKDQVVSMLEAVGLAVEVPESEMDAITGIAGSSPAFMYMVIDAMVVPAGEQTSSFSWSGCFPVSSTILAEPSIDCAASFMESARERPLSTPASAIASMTMYMKAGELPAIPVMADAGVLNGLSRADSIKLAAQSMLGSAKMVLETGKHPDQLKDEVCSPAGTTIVGVRTLENFGLRAGMIAAIDETVAKSRSMSKK